MAKYKIKVDNEKCIGCGTCAAIAPKTFQINSNMKAEVKKGEGDDDTTTLQAAQSCPTNAVIVEEDGKQVYPE